MLKQARPCDTHHPLSVQKDAEHLFMGGGTTVQCEAWFKQKKTYLLAYLSTYVHFLWLQSSLQAQVQPSTKTVV